MTSTTHFIPNSDLDSIGLCRAAWAGGWKVGGSVLITWMVSRNSRYLVWGSSRTVVDYSVYGAPP